eukprot:CAMPEP_0204577516 /NCGR_PEP_ID=MMETSP0661-20131031/42394_1 /ASSEMBLY_ACC=CAM_ASM_000606 /TAXON_ID=109239 /ORGANISM="Alexandrium margalefi, Strain AMGDE01CS-322" /LENGTH=180 /DNA_ID=CAMNT_0051586359 /DNA_START=72 /DNA_END=610 /DNA_ORIENTATION=+
MSRAGGQLQLLRRREPPQGSREYAGARAAQDAWIFARAFGEGLLVEVVPDHSAEHQEHEDVDGRDAEDRGAQGRQPADLPDGEGDAQRVQDGRHGARDVLPGDGGDDEEDEARRQRGELDPLRAALLVVPAEAALLVGVEELHATLQLLGRALRGRDAVGEAALQLGVLRQAPLLQREDG